MRVMPDRTANEDKICLGGNILVPYSSLRCSVADSATRARVARMPIDR